MAPVMPGQVVGNRYRTVRSLGRGGMGEVLLAEDPVLGRLVAVKCLLGEVSRDSAAGERQVREARSAARLHHPNVVAVYDYIVDGGDAYIVMEYVDATNLDVRLANGGPLPRSEAASIGYQVADALVAAHEAGIVHRDVKPSNVLVDSRGRAKLTDFGIARLEDDPGLTVTGQMIGSAAYMPPELARGDVATPASDVYSLGATLFALFEGHSPFQRPGEPVTNMTLLLRLTSEVAPVSVHAGPLSWLLARMMSPEPGQRPTAAQVRDLLAAHAAVRGAAHDTIQDTVVVPVLLTPVTPVPSPSALSVK